MATKKNNNDTPVSTQERPTAIELWARLKAQPEVGLSAMDYGLPVAAASELITTAEVMVERVGGDATEMEQEARDGLEEVCEVGTAVLAENLARAAEEELDQRAVRHALVRDAYLVDGFLDLAARSDIPALADEANAVRVQTFGVDFEPKALTARALHHRVKAVEVKLAEQPELRARLEALVPGGMLAQLSRHRAEVGARLRDDGGPGLDEQLLLAHLRNRMARFVVVFLASAVPSQPSTVARSMRVLEPLARLRAEKAKARGRRAGKEEGEAEPDDPVIVAPEGPVTATGRDG